MTLSMDLEFICQRQPTTLFEKMLVNSLWLSLLLSHACFQSLTMGFMFGNDFSLYGLCATREVVNVF